MRAGNGPQEPTVTPTDREAVLTANGVALAIFASTVTSVAPGSTLPIDAGSGGAINRETTRSYCHGTVSNLQKQYPEVPPLFYSPSRQANVSQLIGKRCMVSCMIDGTKTQALWDTGAQVTIIPADWRVVHLPQAKLRPLCELLGGTDPNLMAANGSPIPYDGWLNVSFSLKTGLNHKIKVPVLVTQATSGVPIIGYNVIEEIVQRDPLNPNPVQAVRVAFPSMTRTVVTALARLIQEEQPGDICCVNVGKKGVTIPGRSVTEVLCAEGGILHHKCKTLW